MERAVSRKTLERLALAALLLAFPGGRLAAADRPPLTVGGVPGCEGVSGRYVAWLRGADPGLIVSSAEFPGARGVPVDPGGRLADPAFQSFAALTVPGADRLWALRIAVADPRVEGCLSFDKDRFTWEGDLVSYVRYLGGLLSLAQGFDSSVRTLDVGGRTLALEVRSADGAAARLEGPEGAMQGLGRWSDPVRHFFLPVVVGLEEDRVLVRILRNQGEPFGARSTEAIGAVLLPLGGDVVVSETEPAFELRVAGVTPPP